MDDGYTEHSGCPVVKGEKWITTAWMREGVTKEDSWTRFDPSGVRLMEKDYYDNVPTEEVGEDQEEGEQAVGHEEL